MAGSSPAMTKKKLRPDKAHFFFIHPVLAHSSFTIPH
jgi:hypothetical protein